MTQDQLHAFLLQRVKAYYPLTSITENSDFIYAKGDIPVLLVAHLDTVYNYPPTNIIEVIADNWWSPQGIGGDDRCGVFAILEILKQFRPHVLFCTDEELGGIGALQVRKTLPVPAVNFIIEIDRRGKDEAVFYGCRNPLFQQMIIDHGFQLERGLFSDISIFAPQWNIAAVNVSAGYFNEHTLNEYINTKYLDQTIAKVKNILMCSSSQAYTF